MYIVCLTTALRAECTHRLCVGFISRVSMCVCVCHENPQFPAASSSCIFLHTNRLVAAVCTCIYVVSISEFALSNFAVAPTTNATLFPPAECSRCVPRAHSALAPEKQGVLAKGFALPFMCVRGGYVILYYIYICTYMALTSYIHRHVASITFFVRRSVNRLQLCFWIGAFLYLHGATTKNWKKKTCIAF